LNILLVRLRLIGDVVFTTPVIAALRQRYPSARLTYLVESSAAPVVGANAHLTDVITVPRRHGWKRIIDDLRLGWRLHRARFDVVVDLHGGPRSAWLTWASGAPVRVGYDVPGRAWMYTRVVHRPRGWRPRHAVENQWALLPALDPMFPASPTRERHRTEMPVTPPAADAFAARLAMLGVSPTDRVMVLHVSAGNPFRRWPEHEFAQLAAALARAGADRWVLITSGPSDRDAAHRVLTGGQALAGDAAPRIVSADALSLAELRAAMERAALFVGGDSGPMHVASTSDVPIVALYGPTLPGRSDPWRPRSIPTAAVDAGELPCRPCDQRVCAPGDFRCLTSVPAAAVHAAAERVLEMPR
jgi:lipopolysaccharide heptosyltransferase II